MWASIDPGVKYLAEAIWDGHTLTKCRLVKMGEPKTPADMAVIEKPQVYKMAAARSADIVDLAIAAGIISSYYPRTVWRLPASWKGQVPKPIHHQRILQQLTPQEKDLLVGLTKGELKHIMDAIGLGLVHTGRL
jgi:hypothetical protein